MFFCCQFLFSLPFSSFMLKGKWNEWAMISGSTVVNRCKNVLMSIFHVYNINRGNVMFDRDFNSRFKPFIEQLCKSANAVSNLRNWLATVQKTKRRFLSTLSYIAFGCLKCSFLSVKCLTPWTIVKCMLYVSRWRTKVAVACMKEKGTDASIYAPGCREMDIFC